MTAAARASAARVDAWEERGRRAAPLVSRVSSVVVVGVDPDHAARAALGIARAECGSRSVALGDLVGDLAPLYTVAGGEDAAGLTDCLRDERPLDEIARPSTGDEQFFILPSGTPPVATPEVFAHDRWPRLVRGFAEARALLILVAPLGAPGLDALLAITGGVVTVDVPPHRVPRHTVLGSVDSPSASSAHPQPPRPRGRSRVLAGVALACAIVAVATLTWVARPRAREASPSRAVAATPPSRPALASPSPPATIADPAPAVTMPLGGPVNPGDSLRASVFAVEVVAANTLAGANSFVRDAGDIPLSASTVAPVQLGGGSLWYRAIVGAWRSRAGAESLLTAFRSRGVLQQNAGIVVQVPYALLLATVRDSARAREVVRSWSARGIPAYALVQEDGSVRVFAGAFETAGQAAPLAASLKDAGATPVVAFRTGRPF